LCGVANRGGGLAWQPREAAATVVGDSGGRARGREQATAVVGGRVGGGRRRGSGACAGWRPWAGAQGVRGGRVGDDRRLLSAEWGGRGRHGGCYRRRGRTAVR
jgi:hypothetical protein